MSVSERVTVVLVRPSRPGNVAAACRAMKNMGLHRLSLVEVADGWNGPESRGLAWGAWDVLDAAVPVDGLAAAVADSQLVVGTSSRDVAGAWNPRELAARVRDRPAERVALVFGPESSGLSDAELGLCHAQVVIPCDPAQPSLNLAQAVLLLAWEIFAATRKLPGPASVGRQRASVAELEAVLAHLHEALLGIGYLDPQSPERRMVELRRMLARAEPTRREAALLRGLARQVLWAARLIARGPASSG